MQIRFACQKGGLTMINMVSVLTQHNDNSRTGANLQEVRLTTSNVNSSQFGKLFTRKVDGHIYAQPLYVSNVTIPNKGTHNVVYVATMHNYVYAFDADDPRAAERLWEASLGLSVRLPDPNIGPRSSLWPTLGLLLSILVNLVKHPMETFSLLRKMGKYSSLTVSELFGGYKDISCEVGIVSTPVISLAHNTLYAVAFTKVGNAYAHHLHALDLTTGADKFGGPVQLGATVPGNGDGRVKGCVPFISHLQVQRSALLLHNDIVYVTFPSYGAQDPYHGLVFSYHATTLHQVAVYNTTPDGGEGGIWMAGQGPASAGKNNVYFMSGTWAFQRNQSPLGHIIVHIKPDLRLSHWFAPFN